ncbi:MAG: thermonuclease family protein [Solirubrobacterales bacterium]|jgi:micrococcal nuclease|nr:thermonuclease family protein [Solirubrobacterales bacterium]
MELRTALTLLVLAAVAAGFGDRLGVLDSFGAGTEPPAGVARVERVVDGDTIRVRLDGKEETVRYIGVDTPETKKPGTGVECFGKAASAENERLVEGEQLRLTVGEEARDRYGRLLAYVRRERDGLFVNERLLAGGYAKALTIRPNDRYELRFKAVETRARVMGAGLWSRC